MYIDNSNTSSPLIYGDFSTDVLTINGQVGIGTTSPSNLQGWGRVLDVRGPGNHAKILATTTNATYRMGVYADAGWNGGGGFVGTESNHTLHLIANYAPKMSILTNGRVGIGTTSPSYLFQVLNAYTDGNSWYNASDVNLKTNFRPIQEEAILDKLMQLKIERWNYRGVDNGIDHIGPIAQEFNKIFNLGGNEKAISTVDELGVALAAIQELNRKTEMLLELVKSQQDLLGGLLLAETVDNSLNATLFQNTPNPFTEATEIRIFLSEEIDHATLVIYDLLGKERERRVVPDRGNSVLAVHANGWSEGTYFYVLIADGRTVGAKRMILAR